jgi:hypothetical protein
MNGFDFIRIGILGVGRTVWHSKELFMADGLLVYGFFVVLDCYGIQLGDNCARQERRSGPTLEINPF